MDAAFGCLWCDKTQDNLSLALPSCTVSCSQGRACEQGLNQRHVLSDRELEQEWYLEGSEANNLKQVTQIYYRPKSHQTIELHKSLHGQPRKSADQEARNLHLQPKSNVFPGIIIMRLGSSIARGEAPTTSPTLKMKALSQVTAGMIKDTRHDRAPPSAWYSLQLHARCCT